MKILMVCLGNICRSPLAEGILRAKIDENGLDWKVDSAGTGDWHVGEKPDHRSIKVARKHGIDISGQAARQIKPSDLDEFDLILAMDTENLQDILKIAKGHGQAAKVHLITSFSDNPGLKNIPDPYWNDDGFEPVFNLLEHSCDAVIEHFLRQGTQ
jgi:protein-tyrosine phosphatase